MTLAHGSVKIVDLANQESASGPRPSGAGDDDTVGATLSTSGQHYVLVRKYPRVHQIWDIASGSHYEVQEISQVPQPLTEPGNSSLFAIETEPGLIIIWDAARKVKVGTATSEERRTWMTLSPDGRLLAFANSGYFGSIKIQLWDVPTGSMVAENET